jgi:hypothetical protein
MVLMGVVIIFRRRSTDRLKRKLAQDSASGRGSDPSLGAAPVEASQEAPPTLAELPPEYPTYSLPILPDFESFSPAVDVSSADEDLAAQEQAAMMQMQAEGARLVAQASALPPARAPPASGLVVGQGREQQGMAEQEQALARRVSNTMASESKDGSESASTLSVGTAQADAQVHQGTQVQDLGTVSSTGLESAAVRVEVLSDASSFAQPEEQAPIDTPRRSWLPRLFGSQQTQNAANAPQVFAEIIPPTQAQNRTSISNLELGNVELDMSSTVPDVRINAIDDFAVAEVSPDALEVKLHYGDEDSKYLQRDKEQVSLCA